MTEEVVSAGSTSTNSDSTLVGIPDPKDSLGSAENTNFEQWISSQPDDVQGLFETHVSGLKAALASERDSRKALQRSVRELQASAGKVDDLQERLTKLEGDLTDQAAYANFIEAAATANVKNFRLAWLAVKEFDLLKSDGEVDLVKLKDAVPELFTRTAVISAGAGTGAPPQVSTSMNDLIRNAAGRNSR